MPESVESQYKEGINLLLARRHSGGFAGGFLDLTCEFSAPALNFEIGADVLDLRASRSTEEPDWPASLAALAAAARARSPPRIAGIF